MLTWCAQKAISFKSFSARTMISSGLILGRRSYICAIARVRLKWIKLFKAAWRERHHGSKSSRTKRKVSLFAYKCKTILCTILLQTQPLGSMVDTRSSTISWPTD